VSFIYPGDTSLKPAIRNCSLSIYPGQLVVIVGGNGSGKSSFMKLLTRAYEPTSGDVLFDGTPAKEFQLRDLREATAVLAQDHELLEGLSIKENVGLGRWQHADDEDLIRQSLELSGAQSVVAKFKKGLNTILKPAPSKWSNNVQNNDDAQLKSMFDDLEKHSEVSGGEQQRLVA
jgi:ABC-type multidrug transport system fused ATPase/permease subunit